MSVAAALRPDGGQNSARLPIEPFDTRVARLQCHHAEGLRQLVPAVGRYLPVLAQDALVSVSLTPSQKQAGALVKQLAQQSGALVPIKVSGLRMYVVCANPDLLDLKGLSLAGERLDAVTQGLLRRILQDVRDMQVGLFHEAATTVARLLELDALPTRTLLEDVERWWLRNTVIEPLKRIEKAVEAKTGRLPDPSQWGGDASRGRTLLAAFRDEIRLLGLRPDRHPPLHYAAGRVWPEA